MYIKSIIMEGFKSYNRRTEVTGFDKEFTAITGLNGSGKSNILDSICFVLGLTNLKQVRCNELQELVYKQGQAGVTKASVTIVFDNRDKDQSPPGFGDCEEITITRQVLMGGKAKYMLNGSTAPNKKIQDLFCSVQMNVNNPHFLVFQGRIAKVLNMKPPEFLAMVEEAAGTRMYESKKQAAEKTIAKKDAKLLELDKIITDEIRPKLEKLKDERQQYVAYQEVERELESISKLFLAWKWLLLQAESEKLQTELQDMDNKVEGNNDSIAEMAKERESSEVKLQEIHEKRDKETGGKLKSLEKEFKEKEKVEIKIASIVKSTKDNIESEEKKIKQMKKVLKDDENCLKSKEKELLQAEEVFKKLREADEADAAAFEMAQRRFEAASAGMVVGEDGEAVTLQEQLMNAKQAETEAKTEIQQAEMRLQQNQTQLRKKKRQSSGSNEDYENDQRALKTLENEMQTHQKRLSSLNYDKERVNVIKTRRQELGHKVQRFQSRIDAFEAQYPLTSFHYRDPEPNFDRKRIHGLVCKLITIKDVETATALETAAGGRLYNLVVDTHITSKLLLEKGELQQRTTIIPLNKIKPRAIDDRTVRIAQQLVGPENVQTALSLVNYPPESEKAMEYIFGGVFICKDRASAKAVAFDRRIQRRCVTLDGDVVDPAGTLTGGSLGAEGMMLAALHELKDTMRQLEQYERELAELDTEYRNMSATAEQYESIEQRLDMCQHEFNVIKQRLEQNTHHQQQAEIEQLQNEIDELTQKIKICQKKQAENKKRAKDIEEQIADTKGHRERQLKEAKQEMQRLKTKAENSRKQLEQRDQEYDSLKLEITELEKALENGKQQIVNIQKIIEELNEQLENSEIEHMAAKEEVSKLAQDVAEVKKEMSTHNLEIQRIVKRNEQLEKRSSELSLELKRFEHEREEIVSKIKEANSQVNELVKSNKWLKTDDCYVPKARALSNKEGKNLSKRTQELKEQHALLSRTVNKRAMNLLDTEEQQYKEMMKRKQIVKSDKKKIMDVIADLDKKKEKAIQVAWEQVNKNLGMIFSKLLPGTDAKLQPPVGQTFMDGLEIKVCLGGVWKESLSELSGGQKSLVALSLILAMLLFKPAPIYILDEVDSALDLSHTQNIGQMLKSHFKGSQFIVVSLKEGMFSHANVLFKTQFVDGTSSITRTVSNQ